MKKNSTQLSFNRIIAIFTFVLAMISGTIFAQSWTIYDGSVLPNANVPAFVTASGSFNASENEIKDDTDNAGNKYLWMDVNGNPQSAFLWRMNFPSDQTTEITIVMRVRGHADRDMTLDLDMDFNKTRSRISIQTETKLLRIRNGAGTNVTLGEEYDPTVWNTYRFTMTPTETRVYLNEEVTPVLTLAPAVTTNTNRYFRFGDGDNSASYGADIDWVIWDLNGAYAPGEGIAIPNPVVAPSMNADLGELKIDNVDLTGFNPAVLTYEVVLAAGTTDAPVVSAQPEDSNANVVITQATTIPGSVTIEVTAENGITKKTYTVSFRIISDVATLQQIAVNGDAIAGFDPDVLAYTVNLPLETTTEIALVTAVATALPADVAITQATEIEGQATIVVTAEDGIATLTYTITFTLVSTDATLSDLLVDGTTVAGFDAAVLEYSVFYPTGTTDIPVVSAVTANANATTLVTQATEFPGVAAVVVTAEDGQTELTYTVNLLAGASDAELADLHVDGVTIEGFDKEKTEYFVVLPAGTTAIPVIAAIASEGNASVVIVQALQLPGVATVTVTAEDNFTVLVYTVNIRTQSVNADLEDLLVGGFTVADFSADVVTYTIELPAGTTEVPVVTAMAADANATVVITAATQLPGSTSVKVTAEDGVTEKTYTVSFTVKEGPLTWRVYDARVMPDANVPVFGTSGLAGTGMVSTLIADPDNAENSFLELITVANGDNGTWRHVFAEPVTDLTVVMRVKSANDNGRRVLELDLDNGGWRERLYINQEENKLRLQHSDGFGANNEFSLPDGGNVKDWNIYRLTKNATGAVKLYVNENPVPLAEGQSTVVSATNNHFRFGDTNGSHNVSGLIDWIIWDATGAYAPGEGSAIPANVVAPNWDATLAELLVDGVMVDDFLPATTEYDVVLPLGTTDVPQISAVKNFPDATITITQATGLPGTATVEVTAANGFTVINYVINFVLGTSVENLAERGFSIYPNPASDHINLVMSQNIPGSRLQVINTSGQVVMQRIISSSHEILDISVLRQGVYIIQIVSESEQARQLFIKQ